LLAGLLQHDGLEGELLDHGVLMNCHTNATAASTLRAGGKVIITLPSQVYFVWGITGEIYRAASESDFNVYGFSTSAAERGDDACVTARGAVGAGAASRATPCGTTLGWKGLGGEFSWPSKAAMRVEAAMVAH
jgi:hypothetical protein